jgi:hypothetical protein
MGFFDGGGKSLSFGEIGTQAAAAAFNIWRGGVIVDIGDARQATDINTRAPKTWDNGDPMMQLPITLDTARGNCPERAESADDDLRRTLFVTKGKQMYAAARAALRAAKVEDFAVGGSLYVKWVSGEGRRGDARQYEMYYEPPVASSGGFMAEQQPAQPAAAMPPQQPPPGQQHPSEVYAAAGGPPAQGYPAGPPASPAPVGAPPQPVWNAATNSWDLPAPAAPAAPPPPPQPVWNAATGQWDLPGGPPSASAPPVQQPAPAANGWSPGQSATPAGPGPQASNQPAGNPFARRD